MDQERQLTSWRVLPTVAIVVGLVTGLAQLDIWLINAEGRVIRVFAYGVILAFTGVLISTKLRRRRYTITAGIAIAVSVIAIALSVILWPTAEVPSLVGLAPERACADLREAGLRCAPKDNEATREVNVVHWQDRKDGAVVPKGTTVRYTYESTAPLPLQRYQAPPPNSANFISPTASGPVGWSTERSLGGVYQAGENGVPGLIPIYQYRCISGCNENLVYFLAGDAGPESNFVYEGEAFRCFNPDAPPPGTRPLYRLWNDKHTRFWAVPGTAEYENATSVGFKDPDPSRGALCYIW